MGNPKQLYVEGRDDLFVIADIATHHGFRMADPKARDFHIEPKESVDAVIAAVRVAISPEFELERLGVVVDCDTLDRNHWGRLVEALKPHYTLNSDLPCAEGTILQPNEPGRPIVGIWLMPDNMREGMLEDFVMTMIPETDPLLAYAREVVPKVPDAPNRFSPGHQSKALTFTWLAWQRESGLPFGTAIKGGFLNPHAPLATSLASWLRELFDNSTP